MLLVYYRYVTAIKSILKSLQDKLVGKMEPNVDFPDGLVLGYIFFYGNLDTHFTLGQFPEEVFWVYYLLRCPNTWFFNHPFHLHLGNY